MPAGLPSATVDRQKEFCAFYTPPQMAQALADCAIRGPGDLVVDPSFGGTVFLQAAHRRLIALGLGAEQAGRQIFGVEYDEEAFAVAGESGLRILPDSPGFLDGGGTIRSYSRPHGARRSSRWRAGLERSASGSRKVARMGWRAASPRAPLILESCRADLPDLGVTWAHVDRQREVDRRERIAHAPAVRLSGSRPKFPGVMLRDLALRLGFRVEPAVRLVSTC